MTTLTSKPSTATLPLAGWARRVLADGGITSPSPLAVDGLALWGYSEGTANRTNILNVKDVNGDYGTLSSVNLGYGKGRFTNQGVVMYSSVAQGEAANARFLKDQYPQIWATLADPNVSLAQLYRVIQASHFCGYPNCSQVSGTGYPIALASAIGAVNAPAGEGAPVTNATSGTSPSTTATSGCAAKGNVFDTLGIFTLTHCELKAIIGGGLVVVGGLIAVVGLGVLGFSSGPGQKAVRAVTSRTPAGIATNLVGKTKSGARVQKATAPRPKPKAPPKPKAAKPDVTKMSQAQLRAYIKAHPEEVRGAA